jgi:hypothetical protein
MASQFGACAFRFGARHGGVRHHATILNCLTAAVFSLSTNASHSRSERSNLWACPPVQSSREFMFVNSENKLNDRHKMFGKLTGTLEDKNLPMVIFDCYGVG